MPEGGASETWSTSPCCCALLTALCPLPTDADRVGDGGGWGDPGCGLGAAESPSTTGGTGSGSGFEPPDFALAPDFADPLVSDFSRLLFGVSA